MWSHHRDKRQLVSKPEEGESFFCSVVLTTTCSMWFKVFVINSCSVKIYVWLLQEQTCFLSPKKSFFSFLNRNYFKNWKEFVEVKFLWVTWEPQRCCMGVLKQMHTPIKLRWAYQHKQQVAREVEHKAVHGVLKVKFYCKSKGGRVINSGRV